MVNAFFVTSGKPRKARNRAKCEFTVILSKNRLKGENCRVKQEFGPFPNTALSKNRVKQNRVNQEQSVNKTIVKLDYTSKAWFKKIITHVCKKKIQNI